MLTHRNTYSHIETHSNTYEQSEKVSVPSEHTGKISTHLAPKQPILDEYPARKFGNETFVRRFQSEWYKNYPWISYEVDKDACVCFACVEFGKDTSFVFRNWKKSAKLAKHGKSESHVRSMTRWLQFKANTDVGFILYNFLECNNLSQLIEEPTRISLHGETILDLIVTDSPGFFISSGTLSPPANCDHNIVFANLHILTRKKKAYKCTVRNYINVDVAGLNTALNVVNWDSAFNGHNETIDCIYDKWINLSKSIVDVYIPIKHVTIRSKGKPWMNGAIRRAIRKRYRLLSVYSKHKNTIRWERYRIQINFVVSLIRQAKCDYFSKVNSDLGNPAISSKKGWKLSKSLLSNKFHSPVPDLIVNGNTISEPKDKAEAFNQFFVSQSCLINDEHAVVPLLSLSMDTLSTIVIDELEVFNILNNLDVSKACGFDNISNKILKLCAATIFTPFTHLINTSLSLGQYPTCWKMANVIPLFKKNNRQFRSNYRPISLLVSLSKICEKVV